MNQKQLKDSLAIAEHYFQSHNYKYAETILKGVIAIDVANIKANELLAYIYENQGNIDLAYHFYDVACDDIDANQELLYNFGSFLLASAKYEKAKIIFYKSLKKFGNSFEALHDLAVSHSFLGEFKSALIYYSEALKMRDDSYELFFNVGRMLDELKRYDEAIFYYEKALSINSNVDWTYGNFLHAKMKICSWSGLAESLEDISKKVVANERVIQPFPLLSLSDSALLHKKAAEVYIQSRYPFNSILGPIPRGRGNKKIRLGYFSADFKNHPVSFLTSELFEIHDRNRFEVFAFSLSGTKFRDAMNLRLRKVFDRFIDVEELSDQEIAQLARELKVDIAIDLAGPTEGSRTGIFSYRAAPIQVNWLGYPGTIGADFIDYIVADKIVIPESQQDFYTEKVVYLPDTYMVDDSRRIPSSRLFTRKDCGLPEDGFVFCCFNNDYKFNPEVLDSWCNILLGVKDSVLWISENNQFFKTNIKNEFYKRGIDSNRIIFAERVELAADYLARISTADLFLDTYPYNAHTTAVDALKAGLPVLTLIGRSFAGRVAASLLHAVGLPELVVRSREEYEELAIKLAKFPGRLEDLKLRLADHVPTTPLFNATLFAKNLEAAYTKIYEKYQAGLQKDHISIS